LLPAPTTGPGAISAFICSKSKERKMRTYNCTQKQAIWQFFLLSALLFVLPLIGPLPAFGQADSRIEALREIGKVFAQIADKARPAVVQVLVEKSATSYNLEIPNWPFVQPHPGYFGGPFDFGQGGPFHRDDDSYYYFFRPQEPPLRLPQPKSYQRCEGSGFIVSKDGHILTTWHVVEGAKTIKVKLADKRELEAKIIGTDSETDIAVLRIDADDLPFLELGDSDALAVGDWVVAANSPFGLGHPFSGGMVTAKGRSGLGLATYEDFIQTDVAITVGDGGGPLLNLDGKVAGINVAVTDKGPGGRVSFAIPINTAKFVYEQLIEHGMIERGFLGVSIQDVSPDMAEALGLKDAGGAVVSQVVEDSAAEKAGIKRHDVIVELNGLPVTSANELRTRIALLKPGTQIEVILLRDGKRVTFAVTLGRRSPLRQPVAAGPDVLKRLGFTVEDLTPELAEHLGYKGDRGVVVTKVETGSEAERQGITAGTLILQVNRRPVKNTGDFNRAVEQGGKKGVVLLLVKDKHYTRLVVLQLK
jgi:serine protease Do